jgi:hypothetical protein
LVEWVIYYLVKPPDDQQWEEEEDAHLLSVSGAIETQNEEYLPFEDEHEEEDPNLVDVPESLLDAFNSIQ